MYKYKWEQKNHCVCVRLKVLSHVCLQINTNIINTLAV